MRSLKTGGSRIRLGLRWESRSGRGAAGTAVASTDAVVRGVVAHAAVVLQIGKMLGQQVEAQGIRLLLQRISNTCSRDARCLTKDFRGASFAVHRVLLALGVVATSAVTAIVSRWAAALAHATLNRA